MVQLRNKSQSEEIDYTFVMDCLKDYKSPRTKLITLLRFNSNQKRLIPVLRHAPETEHSDVDLRGVFVLPRQKFKSIDQEI